MSDKNTNKKSDKPKDLPAKPVDKKQEEKVKGGTFIKVTTND